MKEITSDRIFRIESGPEFSDLALEIFRFQAANNPVYKQYIEILGVKTREIARLEDIPFLPIELFKTHRVITGENEPEIIFNSSGTTGSDISKHHVTDLGLYRESFQNCFYRFYGSPEDYRILALLPSYIERGDSSLVYMAEHLIRESRHPGSGFFLDDLQGLADSLTRLESEGRKNLLLGVSFALLELADNFPIPLENTIIMETGGMKGRREEITRLELHARLKEAFRIDMVHSEYGMTELLSQAYSRENGIFHAPPWMKVFIRDQYDPMSISFSGSSGGINIIDLANIHSCSFLATQDVGKIYANGGFEVLGRFDNADLRGCNLMME